MKIGILHLTDLHLKESSNWIIDKHLEIYNAIKLTYENCGRIYIVFSGDIAFSGKENEYSLAYNFLNDLVSLLNNRYSNKVFNKIIVSPGNHDCDFDLNTQMRINVLDEMSYDKIGSDDSVVKSCLSVQDSFFNFEGKLNLNKDIETQLYTSYIDKINNKSIVFHCYNTAWMSSKNEKPIIFYPVRNIKDNIYPLGDFNISVFHHGQNWLKTNTTPNNRIEFKEWIIETSDIILRGHEHELEAEKTRNVLSNDEVLDFSGVALYSNDNCIVNSGFQTIVIDLENKYGELTSYSYNESIYIKDKNREFQFNETRKRNCKYNLKHDLLKKRDDIKLPLFDDDKANRLRDIYVFPDLEKNFEYDKSNKTYDDYIDSEILLDADKYRIVVLEGESQSGKSSLLNMLFLSYFEKGKYPIFIDGKLFTESKNVDSIIRKSFQKEYDNGDFDKFYQEDENSKVVLIDNLDLANIKGYSLFELFDKLRTRFSMIVITTSSLYNGSFLGCDFDDILYARILPLGYRKRNLLIERFHILNQDYNNNQDQLFLETIKTSYEQVQTFLGDKLMPSYPVFILSLLQAMNLNKGANYEQTSYGYCYQTLIHSALAVKAKIKNDDIDTYYNYLSELAYLMYKKSIKTITEIYVQNFHLEYSKQYICMSFSEIQENILKSGIVVKEDGCYKFGYNYIFYFLVARKIADIITDAEGKKDIQYLCENLHKERNANILIFVAHHSKDSYLIDETTITSMTYFEKVAPVTLGRDDSFYKMVEDIIKEFKNEFIDTNIDPLKVREENLEIQDKAEKKINKQNRSDAIEDERDDNQEMSEELIEFNKALRSIEIIGQIIKNRKGSFKIDQLIEITKELYLTTFRVIGFLGEIINVSKDYYSEVISHKLKDADGKTEMAKKLNLFLQALSFNFCLSMFTKIIRSVGSKELRQVFDKVAEEIGTPASELVSFSIKTFYGKLNLEELRTLNEKYKQNPVAHQIIIARVKSYIYNNYLSTNERQKITALLNISHIQPSKKVIEQFGK